MVSDSSFNNNVNQTIRQIYHNYIEQLSKSDRLCLASLILNDLTQDIEPQPEPNLSDPRKFLNLSNYQKRNETNYWKNKHKKLLNSISLKVI